MRVLVSGFSGRLFGGIESFVLSMNEHMGADCVFDYLIEGPDCVHRERIVSRGGNAFHITPVRDNPVRYFLDAIKTMRTCRKAGIGVLYAQLFSTFCFPLILIAKALGYSVVLHAHNANLQNRGFLYKAVHQAGKLLLSFGKYTRLTNSSMSGDFMFGQAKQAQLIHNAVDAGRFRFNPVTRESVRAAHGAQGKQVIGFVGRLSREKNLLFVLEVVREVLNRCPSCAFWLVGDGPMKDEVQERAGTLGLLGSTVMFGHRGDVETLMQGMDVLLLPSFSEGLGMALVEGQASGLRCVTSEGVVPKEAQVNGELLAYLPLSKPASFWAEEIVRILETPHDRESAYGMVKESRFDVAREALKLERILRGASGMAAAADTRREGRGAIDDRL